jgi:hypothetical protein
MTGSALIEDRVRAALLSGLENQLVLDLMVYLLLVCVKYCSKAFLIDLEIGAGANVPGIPLGYTVMLFDTSLLQWSCEIPALFCHFMRDGFMNNSITGRLSPACQMCKQKFLFC